MQEKKQAINCGKVIQDRLSKEETSAVVVTNISQLNFEKKVWCKRQ
ncbi:hypothetical protein [Olivibacter jilunii]